MDNNIVSIHGISYTASGLDKPAVGQVVVGDIVLFNDGTAIDFDRVTSVRTGVIPANADYRGVRHSRPRKITTLVFTSGSKDYLDSDTVTRATP